MNNHNTMIITQVLKENQQLKEQINNLYQYLMMLEQKVSTLGLGTGTIDFTVKMLDEILVNKEVITQEERDKLYKEKVEEPIKEFIQTRNEEIKKEIEIAESEKEENNQ